MSATLHYIHDPLCGWCYGAEPLVRAAAEVDGLGIALHGGCLWPEPTRLPADTRAYIQQADARIGSISGQPFGEAYLSGLLLDPDLVLESRPTIAAVLAAEALDPARTLAMLRAIQHAHYERGLHVVQREVLFDLAAETGFDAAAFAAAMDSAPVDAHIAASRQLMAEVRAGGFPTFLLEIDGHWQGVPHNRFASNASAFGEWLRERLAADATA